MDGQKNVSPEGSIRQERPPKRSKYILFLIATFNQARGEQNEKSAHIGAGTGEGYRGSMLNDVENVL